MLFVCFSFLFAVYNLNITWCVNFYRTLGLQMLKQSFSLSLSKIFKSTTRFNTHLGYTQLSTAYLHTDLPPSKFAIRQPPLPPSSFPTPNPNIWASGTFSRFRCCVVCLSKRFFLAYGWIWFQQRLICWYFCVCVFIIVRYLKSV